MIHTLIVLALTSLTAPSSIVTAARPEAVAQVSANPAAQSPARASAKPVVTGTVNINTASSADLQRLPGIGAKTADRVIEYRQKNGPFKKVEELMNVRGVGEKGFLKLKNQVSVSASKPDHQASQP